MGKVGIKLGADVIHKKVTMNAKSMMGNMFGDINPTESRSGLAPLKIKSSKGLSSALSTKFGANKNRLDQISETSQE